MGNEPGGSGVVLSNDSKKGDSQEKNREKKRN